MSTRMKPRVRKRFDPRDHDPHFDERLEHSDIYGSDTAALPFIFGTVLVIAILSTAIYWYERPYDTRKEYIGYVQSVNGCDLITKDSYLCDVILDNNAATKLYSSTTSIVGSSVYIDCKTSIKSGYHCGRDPYTP